MRRKEMESELSIIAATLIRWGGEKLAYTGDIAPLIAKTLMDQFVLLGLKKIGGETRAGGGHWWWSLFPLPDALENPLRLYQTAIDHLLLRLGKMHLKLKTSSFRHSRVEASQERTRITSEGSG